MHTVSNIHSSGTEAEHACRIRILPRRQHAPLIATTTIVIQVNKNILSEKGGAHCQGFCRQIVYWCKKQGNKFYQKGKCNSPKFSTPRLRHMLFLC